MNIPVMLKPDEAMALIIRSEARKSVRSMLIRSASNAIGHAAVENTASAGDDVDVVVVLAFAHR
jgi:hypothetical protein